jgi:hypothetical protein
VGANYLTQQGHGLLSGAGTVTYTELQVPIMNAIFKDCSMCGKVWRTREDFIEDPELNLIGYQVNFEQLKEGLFLFTHLLETCKTTLAVPAGEFFDLYDGPIFEENKTGTAECPGHCLHQSELRPCPAQCECAFVRDIIGILSNNKKNG